MGSTKIENALVWWSQHVMQFSHMCILWLVEFFALLIYNIEIERNVNVVGIITFYGHLS
jgi:hypothetical protein